MAFGLTLNHVLIFIEQALCELYDLAHHFGVDGEVMSSAVFVFDQRLSIFIPSCARDLNDARRLFDVTGVASLFIAAKSQLARRSLSSGAEDFGRVGMDYCLYPCPISIIRDLLSLLLPPCGY